MVSPEAYCLNFVSPECVRRRGRRQHKGWVINFSWSLPSVQIDGNKGATYV